MSIDLICPKNYCKIPNERINTNFTGLISDTHSCISKNNRELPVTVLKSDMEDYLALKEQYIQKGYNDKYCNPNLNPKLKVNVNSESDIKYIPPQNNIPNCKKNPNLIKPKPNLIKPKPNLIKPKPNLKQSKKYTINLFFYHLIICIIIFEFIYLIIINTKIMI